MKGGSDRHEGGRSAWVRRTSIGAASVLSALAVGCFGASAAMAGSYISPSFACAPASWCYVPGAPTETYFFVTENNAATFPVSVAVGVHNAAGGFYGWAAGQTCPTCSPAIDVSWLHLLEYNKGILAVYNYDPVNIRYFIVTGYW